MVTTPAGHPGMAEFPSSTSSSQKVMAGAQYGRSPSKTKSGVAGGSQIKDLVTTPASRVQCECSNRETEMQSTFLSRVDFIYLFGYFLAISLAK